MKIERMTEIETSDIEVGDRIHVYHYTATCQKITDDGAVFLLDQYLDWAMAMNRQNTNKGGYDGSELIYENQAEVLSTVETSDYNWAAVQKGMYLVANDRAGSAYETFGDYGVKVAAKTGTAQLGDNQVNNAIFICYAPYDNPKVAVAVVVEHGSAGASIASIARDVLDAYFTVKTVNTAPESELSLLQ